jgi:uncharacterized protein YjbJ (UPF0337 family)
MGRNTDDLKGRVEEAAGDLTRGKRLKNEGNIGRAAGSANDAAVDGPADKVKNALRLDRGSVFLEACGSRSRWPSECHGPRRRWP